MGHYNGRHYYQTKRSSISINEGWPEQKVACNRVIPCRSYIPSSILKKHASLHILLYPTYTDTWSWSSIKQKKIMDLRFCYCCLAVIKSTTSLLTITYMSSLHQLKYVTMSSPVIAFPITSVFYQFPKTYTMICILFSNLILWLILLSFSEKTKCSALSWWWTQCLAFDYSSNNYFVSQWLLQYSNHFSVARNVILGLYN